MQKNQVDLVKEPPELHYKIERPQKSSVVGILKQSNDQKVLRKLVGSDLSSENKSAIREVPLFRKTVSASDSFRQYEHQPEKFKGAFRVMKEVNVPLLKSEKIDTPMYMSYYQIVRDRIRERAYTNYTKMSIGEVYITFVIRSDGSLGDAQIVEGRSMANDFLREVGKKSVREAGPFPHFPKELDYPELTFNIAISFQYREE